MELTKDKNLYDTNTVRIKEEEKEFLIYMDNNKDLCMAITDGTSLDKWFNDCRWLDITQEDSKIYDVVGKLYEELSQKEELTSSDINGVRLVSDDAQDKIGDTLVVYDYGFAYRLFFIRNNDEEERKTKPSKNVLVKISKNNPNQIEFINMYQGLQNIEKGKVYTK